MLWKLVVPVIVPVKQTSSYLCRAEKKCQIAQSCRFPFFAKSHHCSFSNNNNEKKGKEGKRRQQGGRERKEREGTWRRFGGRRCFSLQKKSALSKKVGVIVWSSIQKQESLLFETLIPHNLVLKFGFFCKRATVDKRGS